ncbi:MULTISPECIES: large conductance mechanosensitive channel protein MscL [Sphingosinicellaceae]|uniref:large conductance mechanosensitive channel protein MscL n=1 Tax=Sphingosinicellaceae TaxID=2820280 RepID=UPI001C1E3B39|nr:MULTISPECIES: large conductance mechanosensitive channel protein MscL [Polymorphobacter]QYE35578.1 large conductance mechanosensitive channel protein MscL [Polymorphobacter sp. PAMC 29334]UAJ11111.1 large conductance mechanosensitive channel protein MscL [Polymorphobacter megasporae]
MFAEFKTFIARGNVLDLAVAVVIGAAFGAIVASLTEDLIMPLIGFLTGGVDFSSHFIRLGAIPANYTGSLEDYAALKKAGVALFGYGKFLTAVINFVIIAFAIFMLVRAANKFLAKTLAGMTAKAAVPADVVVLNEILAELKKRPLV